MRSIKFLITVFLILGSTSLLAQFDIKVAREQLKSETNSVELMLDKEDGTKGLLSQVLGSVELELKTKEPNYNMCTKDLELCNVWLYKVLNDAAVINNPLYVENIQLLSEKASALLKNINSREFPQYILTSNEKLKDVLKGGKLGPNEFEKLFAHNENGIAVKVRNTFTKDPNNPVKILEYLVVENLRQKYWDLANGTTRESKRTFKLIELNGFFIPSSGIKIVWDKGLELAKKRSNLIEDTYIEEYMKINKIRDLKIEVK